MNTQVPPREPPTLKPPTADHRPRSRRFARTSRVGRLSWHVLRFYLVVMLVLMLFENYLIFPAPRYPAGRWSPVDIQVEDAYFTAEDGTRLHGWYLDHPQPIAHILYCHGNGEHLGYMDWQLANFHQLGFAVFAFDYRGYGRSEGSANEAGVCADGRAARKWLAARAGIPPGNIVLMGRSVGGAVAANLASAEPGRALVLENSFTSLPDVAASIYWFFPVRWFMRSQFNSVEKIRTYHGPLFISHGTVDRIVPFSHGKRLFEACPSHHKVFYPIPDGDHNDAPPVEYYDALVKFIRELPE